MAAPRSMTAFTLNALKGWPQQAAVDFNAKLDPTALSVTSQSRVPQGSVVRLNNSYNFMLGVGNIVAMPMFTFNASDDPDVQNDGGDPATVKGAFIAINPGSSDVNDRSRTGSMMALVAVGAYELVSTNYNAGASYNPNTLLTSPTTDTGGALAGQLTPGTLSTNTIVGVVSRGITDNGYGTNAVAFWPYFLPAGV